VARLTETGHQSAVLASRWDLRDIVVAYRMFERCRQEDFKSCATGIGSVRLSTVKPNLTTQTGPIPNPALKIVDEELHKAHARYAKLHEKCGATALDYLECRTPTMRDFTVAEKQIHREIQEVPDETAR
jgi:hypothetical protein